MCRAYRLRWLSVFLLTTFIPIHAQQPVQMASLRPNPDLHWQRTSPTSQNPDGPVLYQLVFTPGTTGTVAKFDTNPRHLTNSDISDNGGIVSIGALTINGTTGLVSFINSQTFPGTVTSVTAGDNTVSIGGSASAPTIAVNGANVNAAQLGGQPAANYARVDISNSFAAAQFFSAPIYAPIFYDSNNNGYYVDPNGASVLNGLRFNNVDCLNGSCPANGAIRYTPNFHLNAPNGYSVIINWDNGSTPGANVQQLRVGNGQGADAFYVTSAGYAVGSYVNTTDNPVGSGVTGVIVKQGDNYHRTANAAAVAAFVANAFPNGIDFDTSNSDNGTFGSGGSNTANLLLFGAANSGEAIGSQRCIPGGGCVGSNPFGLDFYTNFQKRMWLTQGGSLFMAGGANSNGVTWNNASDRNLKTAFASISPAQVLQNLLSLPVQAWQYKSDSAGTRHIGPVAQDFYAAFAVGDDNRHISTVDEGGVALVAIQGLNQKLEEQLREKDAQIAAQQKQMEAMQQQMSAMMRRLKTVEKSVAGSQTQSKLLAAKQ